MNAELLKKSILQWAIEGKLVSQIDSDSEVKQVSIVSSEVPFSIPSSWKWTTLESVGKWKAGGTPSRSHREYYDKGTIPWLKTGDLNDGLITEVEESITELGLENSSAHVNPKGSVLIAMYGATIGKVGVLGMDCATNQARCACAVNESIVDNWFLFYYLLSQRQEFIKKSAGGAQSNISRAKIIEHPMPLPPIKEQRRIVEKLNEILPIVANYGEEQEALERLEKALPGKLRASLLQEAIQGKLVPQIDEEPSVEQIGVPPEDVPFAIPEKWKWVTIGSVCEYIQRGKSPRYSDIQEIPVVAQKCNQWDGFHIEKAKFIDPETADSYKKERWLQEGDVLWNSTGLGTLGRVALYEEHLNPYGRAVADSHVTVLRSSNLIYSKYLYFYICSPTIQSIVEEISSGSTKQKELATTTIKNLFIPLPPILEQHRIVDRIVQLLDDVKDLV